MSRRAKVASWFSTWPIPGARARGGFETRGSACGVVVQGTTAYVADFEAGLEILDVKDPAHVVRLGGFDTSGHTYGVQVVGRPPMSPIWKLACTSSTWAIQPGRPVGRL